MSQGCVSAIDGTNIRVKVSSAEALKYHEKNTQHKMCWLLAQLI